MPDEIIEDALERFRYSEDGSAETRQNALDDINFARLSDQWKAADREMRQAEGRPCLTVNRLPTFIRQVVNDARQNKPSISVHPVDNGADYDTAQVIGGLIRAIERGSNASLAYDTAIDHAASGGFGFFRITTDYCHPESFDQELRIERVANPFSVHWDTSSMAFDASDWRFAFVSEMITDGEFKRRYGKKAKFDRASWPEGAGEGQENWIDEDAVRIAEYWLREEKKRKIVRLTDGRVVQADALDKPMTLVGLDGNPLVMPIKDALALEGVAVNGEREATYYEVKRRMISAVEVLEEETWPGSMIPIVPVWGEEVVYRGKRHFRSLIRDAIGAQMMFNFFRSAAAEVVALTPRAPFIVPTGAIPPHEQLKWQTANTRSHAYLEFDASVSGGMMPQRQPFAGVPAGALQEALNAQDDMKSVIGIFDASLGARSNETSGRAIQARQREADKGTFHFIDNMARAIQYAGRVLIECIPSVYSERQTIQILGEDEAQKVVQLVASRGEAPTPEDPDGKLYDLSAGKYDVTVTVGPNYQTQRQESVAALTELMRAYPPAAEAIGDLYVKNMDWPGADAAVKRIQLLQFARGLEMGLPYDVLAKQFPEVARDFPPPQPAMPPGVMPQNQMMQGAPQGALPVSGGM